MVSSASKYADENSWQRRQGHYLRLVDALIENLPVPLDGNSPDVTPENGNAWNDRPVDAAGKPVPLAVK
jgi:hypothetical protein